MAWLGLVLLMRGFAKFLKALFWQVVESFRACVDMRVDLREHTFLPIAFYMFGDLMHRFLPWEIVKGLAYLVGHINQPVECVAHSAACAAMRRRAATLCA